jgi:hypothetical protein
MYTSFENMPDSARIWIYQASRPLTANEQEEIKCSSQAFLEEWVAHGKDLKTSFDIRKDQFLLIAVDEAFNNATGCSIDTSVAFMKSLDSKYQLDLFDRSKIAFIFNDKIQLESLSNLKNKVQAGEIHESAFIVNNAITTVNELKEQWILPVMKSWAAKYFNQLQQN